MGKNKSDLVSKLNQLSNSDGFSSNPFEEEVVIRPKKIDDIPKIKKKKSKKKDTDYYLDDTDEFLKELEDDDYSFDFDTYVERAINIDEDIELKNSLISMGRKYARSTAVDGETSEISKAFSSQENTLNSMLQEVNRDKMAIEKDIDNMRMMRSKNYKNMAELIEAKSTYHNLQLSIIKEINNIKKSEFDIKLKHAKNKQEENASLGASNQALQKLFSIGHSNLVGAMGGREASVSDYEYDDTDGIVPFDQTDEYVQAKYFSDVEETDGDIFIKYEKEGVQYVLLYDTINGTKQVVAEDKNGNIVPDYPMPSDVDELEFNINDKTGLATDQLHRSYIVRYLNDD